MPRISTVFEIYGEGKVWERTMVLVIQYHLLFSIVVRSVKKLHDIAWSWKDVDERE